MFKEHTVVMLPTNEKARLYIKGTLKYGSDEVHSTGQHLYILSGEEIKAGNHFLTDIRNRISDNNGIPIWELKQCLKVLNEWIFSTDNDGLGYNPYWCKKIIATTNNSLITGKGLDSFSGIPDCLPQPSLEFIQAYIKAYNKGNVITEVMVEYENHALKEYDKPRVNPRGNTITIRKLKTSWTREEVEKLCKAAYRQGAKDEVHGGSWFFGNEWVEKILQL